MAEYAIFLDRDNSLSLGTTPVATIKFDKGTVTLNGDLTFLEGWIAYFQNPSGGWAQHLAEPEPLLSLFGRMTYPVAEVLEGDDASDRYTAATQQIGGQTVTIGGGSFTKARIED